MNKQSSTISHTELLAELSSLGSRSMSVLTPAGALNRRIPIVRCEVHGSNVELHAGYGEVLSFAASANLEIRRSVDETQIGRAHV